MAKILVTGAAGFIGSHLAERLKKDGHDVLGVDNFSDYYAERLKRLNAASLESQGIDLLALDLATDLSSESSGQSTPPLPKDIEFIYHLAAQPGIASDIPFEDYLQNNIVATDALLKKSLEFGSLKSFFYISTSSVYGKEATGSEESLPKPISMYGVTKLAAEQLALSYSRDGKFDVSAFRLFSVYGPRERPEKLFSKLIDSVLEGTDFPLYEGSTEHVRSFTYVGDIVDGLVSALPHSATIAGEILNLGTETTRTTGEGIRIVEDLLGKKAALRTTPARQGDQRETRASIAKAREILGYDPRTTLEEGLKKQVEWRMSLPAT